MNEYVKAWQCIGCGTIEASQTCIGVCQDRKVEFVYAFEHEEALAQLKVAHQQVEVLEALVRRLARTNPHNDAWEHSYRALQEQAREILASIGSGALELGAPTDANRRTTVAKPFSATNCHAKAGRALAVLTNLVTSAPKRALEHPLASYR
jgi:hypothetical protein